MVAVFLLVWSSTNSVFWRICRPQNNLLKEKASPLTAFLPVTRLLWTQCVVSSVACDLRFSSGIGIETISSERRIALVKAGMSTVTNPSNIEMKTIRNPNRYKAVAAGIHVERSCFLTAGLSLKLHFLPQPHAILVP